MQKESRRPIFAAALTLFFSLTPSLCFGADILEMLESSSFQERCHASALLAENINKDISLKMRAVEALNDPILGKEKEVRIRAVLKSNYTYYPIKIWHIPDQYRYQNGKDICKEIYESVYSEYERQLPDEELGKGYSSRFLNDLAGQRFCEIWWEQNRDMALLERICKRSERSYVKERILVAKYVEARFTGYFWCRTFCRKLPLSFEERYKLLEKEVKSVKQIEFFGDFLLEIPYCCMNDNEYF